LGDDVCPPERPHWELAGQSTSEDGLPEWVAAMVPGLAGEEASKAATAWARYAEELRGRTRAFVRRAVGGAPCRLVDQQTGRAPHAKYRLDERATKLTVEELPIATVAGCSRRRFQECCLARVRNIWVCSDSALARRVHGGLRQGTVDADLACLLLIDDPAGPFAIVERGAEAREEFLDCMAVLIATQRLRSEPELTRCLLPDRLPPPEAQLRPVGRSLQSVHLSGPICLWLANVGEDVMDAPGEEELRARNGPWPPRGDVGLEPQCTLLGAGGGKLAARDDHHGSIIDTCEEELKACTGPCLSGLPPQAMGRQRVAGCRRKDGSGGKLA